MSQSSFLLQHGSSTQASTSAHPYQAISASYHPLPRPKPLPPLEPVDTQAVKQELRDALGENGLPYWKAMNGYLLGQVGKVELEGMVRRWLPKDRLYLHNKLLFSILTNASATRQPPPSAAAALQKKRRRVAPDHPEYDTDDVTIEAKSRVAHWNTSLTVKDRNRLKRLMAGRLPGSASVQSGANGADGGKDKSPPGSARPNGAEAEGGDWMAQLRQSSAFTPRTFFAPPATSDGSLPSSSQLAERLASLAPAYGLSVSPDAASEIGEFLAVGMDAHMVDILHGVVSLTGADRPSGDGIHLAAALGDVEVQEEADSRGHLNGVIRKRSIANGHPNGTGQEPEAVPGKWRANGAVLSGPVNGKRKWGESNGDNADDAKGKGDAGAGGKDAAPLVDGSKDHDGDINMNGTDETDGPVQPLFRSPEALKASIAKWSSAHAKPIQNGEGPTTPGDRTRQLPAPFSLPSSETRTAHEEPAHSGTSPKKRKSTSQLSQPAASAHPQTQTKAKALPRPTLDTLQHLFTLTPALHAQTSPALYKLAASQYQAESSGRRGLPTVSDDGDHAGINVGGEVARVRGREGLRSGRRHSILSGMAGAGANGTMQERERVEMSRLPAAPQANGTNHTVGATGPDGAVESSGANGATDPTSTNGPTVHTSAATSINPSTRTDPPSIASVQRLTGPHRAEMISRIMLQSGLLQPEKPLEEGKKRHTYHWKYEDPALMLRDVLG